MAPRPRLALLALLAITAAVYAPVLGHGFVHYDDPIYVFQNDIVRQGWTVDGVRWAFTTGHGSNWHPLTWLSHLTDVEWFGPDRPGGHHFVNVLFHLLNVLLVYLVLNRLTGATWRSWLVAAIFALHPLRVESVAWISERKDLLSVAFWLGSLLAYERFARTGHRKAYLASLGALALGLMSKPMLVTAPFLLLVLDAWPLDRLRGQWRARVVEKLPMLALVVASSVVTYRVQEAGGSVADFPWGHRLITALMAIVGYPAQFLAPLNLAPLYPNHLGMWTPVEIVGAAAGLTVALAAVFVWRRHRAVSTGVLWYLGTLVPVCGLVQVGRQWMADRYTYFPMIGFALALVWGGAEFVRARPRWRRPLLGVTALAMVAWIPMTVAQVGIWKDSATLFQAGLARTTDNDILENNYGAALLDAGQLDEAIARFRNSVRIRPTAFDAQANLGGALLEKGYSAEAALAYAAAVALRPDRVDVQFGLGRALRGSGQIEEAIQRYRIVTQLDPRHAQAWNNLGSSLGAVGHLPEAIAALRQALALTPDYALAHLNLALALRASGDDDGATRHLQRALELDPTLQPPGG